MTTSSPDSLLKQLQIARRELLDLSTRNRLLHTAREQERGLSLEIKDESSDQVFHMLVTDHQPMRFEQGEIEAPDETPLPEKPKTTKRVTKKKASLAREKKEPTDVADRQNDNVLHTELAPEELDRRLLGLATDAAASHQEQGVNILYLVLGFLKWYEAEKPDVPRFAPLLLVPVKLQRSSAGNRFSLLHTGEDIETNLTLKTRLKVDFGIDLPVVPELDDLSPSVYFQDVRMAIGERENWEVLPNDMVLWFFSFTKLLMYRDLDPSSWPDDAKLEDRPLIRALLQDGFAAPPPLCGDDESIDPLLDPGQTVHVIDCDSSQSLVIEEACRGRSMVIQGPPGTGKSQTITNLIAAAVKAGKTILFVAEKMAALQVVKRRMANIGLGHLCLELHSEMIAKKTVLDDIAATLELGRPKIPPQLQETIRRVTELRDQLNRHAEILHTPSVPSGMTPYQVITELVDLRVQQVALPDFQLSEAANWSANDFQIRSQAMKDYVAVLEVIGKPSEHPWRGSQLEQLLPLDLERLLASTPILTSMLDQLAQSSRQLAQRLNDDPPTKLSEIERLERTVSAILQAPRLDQQALQGTTWDDHRQAINQLAEAGRATLEAKEKLSSILTDQAWETDIGAAVTAYRQHGQSWFRMFRSSYRAARKQLRGILRQKPPKSFDERLGILETLSRWQQARKQIDDGQTLGPQAFGRFWQGRLTDWKQIDAWERWDADAVKLGVSPRFRSMIGLIEGADGLKEAAEGIARQRTEFSSKFKQVADALKLDPQLAFSGTVEDYSLVDLRKRISQWQQRPEDLQHWQRYVRARKLVEPIAGGALIKRLDEETISANAAVTTFHFAYYEALLRQMLQNQPALANFEGGKFQQLIDEFRKLDQERILFARTEVAEAHFQSIRKKTGRDMAEAVQTLRHEMQKKRRHLPLRQLIHEAGEVIQTVKPVFMMSPLSVAQFLEPGSIEFDMLLIDEASQVRPVEALGAAARCRQMVVVGDDKQMPPTQFFGVMVGEVDEEDATNMSAGDVESILSLCIARNMPQRMLRWHYRSRHQSLIAVSNREFYAEKLYVIPSPERSGELGMKFHFVEGGKFVDGVNTVEAKVVAEAVMQHAREHPDWTLGVGTFSMSQRDAVLQELDRLRRADPAYEAFFDPNAPDPFFVKNLENIQGDERDVIIVSVGYGPGENGRVNLNFGPVSAEGGERRLNVLMTRAKRRCDIYSSMRAEDIDLNRAKGRGPAIFRAFLQFAQSGGEVAAAGGSKGRDRFVELVKKQLIERGYQVETNVGVAGVYVDLAVVDANNPGRYLIGIELDGPGYRQARTARDRDRLRQSVLQGQGWQLVRLWSLEWFQRPTEQLNRLVEAIEAARRPRSRKSEATDSAEFQIERHPSSGDPFAAALGGVTTEGASGSSRKKVSSKNTNDWLSGVVNVVVQTVAKEIEKSLKK